MHHIIRALRISEKVADDIPVPGLKSAIGLALHIAEMAEEAKSTRERCRELAERAGKFTLAVYEHLRAYETHPGSSETTEHVATFLWCDIEAYMRRQARKSLFSVMLSNGRKDDDIARLATKLEDAVRLFNIQATLQASAHLSLLATTQSRLLTHADDADRVGALILSRTRVVEAGVTELVQRGLTEDGTVSVPLLHGVSVEFQVWFTLSLALHSSSYSDVKISTSWTTSGPKCNGPQQVVVQTRDR
ncbi:hypothetical protein L226DRAFT_468627 [Lentinus tigrinus ALCF2SS1-7]|uniref:uncharacterized protein n=1 Tax=Lentinus tigrinus ALCF2SS1-7 TaxID=1328758 RepID=UPI0011663E89|nr:hypothetical protein L226DRAFT_468627 [Lentinus tigrinus ALCF2SS1-7]